MLPYIRMFWCDDDDNDKNSTIEMHSHDIALYKFSILFYSVTIMQFIHNV